MGIGRMAGGIGTMERGIDHIGRVIGRMAAGIALMKPTIGIETKNAAAEPRGHPCKWDPFKLVTLRLFKSRALPAGGGEWESAE